MKKKSKRNILLCVLIAVLVLAAIALINLYPLISMSPAETGRIGETEIISVKNNLNSIFFIESDGGYIVIDAGTKKDGVEKALSELSIDSSDVRNVLLTHSDYDHVGSLALFSNAQIHMSEDELQMVNGVTARGKSKFNSLPNEIDINSIELLSDGQELNIGGLSVICIKSPGHTPGSMSYLVDGKYLFTGDAVQIRNSRMLTHPFTMDEQEAQKSIDTLKKAKEGSALLLTAHYGFYEAGNLE